MTCTYPHCEPGQAGTHCRDECRTCCDGKCSQGRECPLLRDDPDPLRDDMLEAVTKVILLAIGIVLLASSPSACWRTYEHPDPVSRHSPLRWHLPRRVPDLPAQAVTAA